MVMSIALCRLYAIDWMPSKSQLAIRAMEDIEAMYAIDHRKAIKLGRISVVPRRFIWNTITSSHSIRGEHTAFWCNAAQFGTLSTTFCARCRSMAIKIPINFYFSARHIVLPHLFSCAALWLWAHVSHFSLSYLFVWFVIVMLFDIVRLRDFLSLHCYRLFRLPFLHRRYLLGSDWAPLIHFFPSSLSTEFLCCSLQLLRSNCHNTSTASIASKTFGLNSAEVASIRLGQRQKHKRDAHCVSIERKR